VKRSTSIFGTDYDREMKTEYQSTKSVLSNEVKCRSLTDLREEIAAQL
jgi:hypothetical protein